jgi:hypothetical protein
LCWKCTPTRYILKAPPSELLISHDSCVYARQDKEKARLTTKGFENVKSQIGFCGIWCGSCLGGNGAVLELTRKY